MRYGVVTAVTVLPSWQTFEGPYCLYFQCSWAMQGKWWRVWGKDGQLAELRDRQKETVALKDGRGMWC